MIPHYIGMSNLSMYRGYLMNIVNKFYSRDVEGAVLLASETKS